MTACYETTINRKSVINWFKWQCFWYTSCCIDRFIQCRSELEQHHHTLRAVS